MHVEKNWSDDISGGKQIGSDTFQNGSDIIRYPTIILSPDSCFPIFLSLIYSNWIHSNHPLGYCYVHYLVPSMNIYIYAKDILIFFIVLHEVE